MPQYLLGVDAGGTKTHALIADETGHALGFGAGGPGNWEDVGLEGLTGAVQTAVNAAINSAGLRVDQINSAGMGLAGYDWPSQREMILGALAPLGLACPLDIVNDATLGILAGTSHGWGVSIVSGTGTNCRGWSRDGREGRVVGGATDWSWEFASGGDIAHYAMHFVSHEWTRRGPSSSLTPVFLDITGAKDINDLVEGLYINKYLFTVELVIAIFQAAHQGNPDALATIRWAGHELGNMACGVIRQLGLENDDVEVVQIGSVWNGHPLLSDAAHETICQLAPRAKMVRLTAPPVVGGVVLALQHTGLPTQSTRLNLLETVNGFIKKVEEE